MSPEDQRMFDDYFDLFARAGWDRLISDLESTAEELDTLEGIKTSEDLLFRKGKIEALRNLITFKDTMSLLYDDRQADEEAA